MDINCHIIWYSSIRVSIWIDTGGIVLLEDWCLCGVCWEDIVCCEVVAVVAPEACVEIVAAVCGQ